MIQLAIHEAINGRDLDYAIARATMEEMMDGTATDIEMATLLTALRMKGETITEITACAEVMREKGAHIEPKGAVMDIVGTGGDEVGSFNISTTAAFVAAAGGVPVAKHGNRSVIALDKSVRVTIEILRNRFLNFFHAPVDIVKAAAVEAMKIIRGIRKRIREACMNRTNGIVITRDRLIRAEILLNSA